MFVSLFAFYIAGQIENSALVVILQSGMFMFATSHQMEQDRKTFQYLSHSSSDKHSNDSHGSTSNRWICFWRTKAAPTLWTVFAWTCQVAIVPALAISFSCYTFYRYVKQDIPRSGMQEIAAIGFSPIVLVCTYYLWCSTAQHWCLSEEFTTGKHEPDDLSARDPKRERKCRGDTNINRRWKAEFVAGIFRIIFTTCFLTGIATIGFSDETVSLTCLSNGLRSMHANTAFVVNIFVLLGSYVLAWIPCSMLKMHRGSFAYLLVVAVSTSGTVALLLVSCSLPDLHGVSKEMNFHFACTNSFIEVILVVFMLGCLFSSQIFASFVYARREKMFSVEKRQMLFIEPIYYSPFTERVLFLNRRRAMNDKPRKLQYQKHMNAKVYICATMYNESSHEQCQLLESLKRLAEEAANFKEFRQYEAHIFFDEGATGRDVNQCALQLLSAIEENNIDPNLQTNLKKFETPYGIQLEMRLPNEIPFIVHLKDGNKVKRSKRWSKVMYMDYIANFLQISSVSDDEILVDPENVFILTTDADMIFQYESIEDLIHHLLQRDTHVGAVCGRTHPVGSGPIVWYQTFDYAIGHWFQKAAEHVFGSVISCYGCFNMFRVKALNTILVKYRSDVHGASQFLMKDMGEDRWLCTILAEAGWRLEYCAAADNETHCPTRFDEFFNQRRRWISSTMVNVGQLCWNGAKIAKRNVSGLFIVYQAIMLFASITSPSTVILIISRGLNSALDINDTSVVDTMLVVAVGYGVTCLLFPQKDQLLMAKLLTCVFVMAMASIVIGVLAQGVRSFSIVYVLTNSTDSPTTLLPQAFSVSDVPVSTWYAIGLASICIAAALLHPFEFHCVLHLLWYLLWLPSGYLFMVIYAICNLDDQNWGTRESSANQHNETAWNILAHESAVSDEYGSQNTSGEEPKKNPGKAREAELHPIPYDTGLVYNN